VCGYYTLTASQVLHEDASERLARGAARHPIPVVLLARLAVDKTAQGHHLGQSLLLDAILWRVTLFAGDFIKING
jgi:hypothetical protein